MGAVTARQRESIPAGTGTTDLPRETVHEGRRRHGWRERERQREIGGGRRWSREREKPPSRRRESRKGGRGRKSEQYQERSKRWRRRRMTDGEEQGLAPHRCLPGCKRAPIPSTISPASTCPPVSFFPGFSRRRKIWKIFSCREWRILNRIILVLRFRS